MGNSLCLLQILVRQHSSRCSAVPSSLAVSRRPCRSLPAVVWSLIASFSSFEDLVRNLSLVNQLSTQTSKQSRNSLLDQPRLVYVSVDLDLHSSAFSFLPAVLPNQRRRDVTRFMMSSRQLISWWQRQRSMWPMKELGWFDQDSVAVWREQYAREFKDTMRWLEENRWKEIWKGCRHIK